MDIETKCSIIEEFMREYILNDDYDEYDVDSFLEYNDIGVPLAQAVIYNLANPTPEGSFLLQETWILFCEMLGIDPEGEYEDMDDIIDELEDEE